MGVAFEDVAQTDLEQALHEECQEAHLVVNLTQVHYVTTTYAVTVVAFVAPQCTYAPASLNTSDDDTRQCMYVLQRTKCPCMTLHL